MNVSFYKSTGGLTLISLCCAHPTPPARRFHMLQYLLSDGIKRAAGGLTNGGSNPMYLGRRMQAFGESSRMYNSGGASYLLNQASVGLLGGHLDDGACRPHTEKPWEDVLVRYCVRFTLLRVSPTTDIYVYISDIYIHLQHCGEREIESAVQQFASKGSHTFWLIPTM